MAGSLLPPPSFGPLPSKGTGLSHVKDTAGWDYTEFKDGHGNQFRIEQEKDGTAHRVWVLNPKHGGWELLGPKGNPIVAKVFVDEYKDTDDLALAQAFNRILALAETKNETSKIEQALTDTVRAEGWVPAVQGQKRAIQAEIEAKAAKKERDEANREANKLRDEVLTQNADIRKLRDEKMELEKKIKKMEVEIIINGPKPISPVPPINPFPPSTPGAPGKIWVTTNTTNTSADSIAKAIEQKVAAQLKRGQRLNEW